MTIENLDAARRTLETALVDTCRIDVDPEGEADDILDDDTLELSEPPDDSEPIYEGPCLLSPVLSDQVVNVGDRSITRRRYRARLPHSAPLPPVGALFTLTATEHDPELVGQRMRVVDVAVRTWNVSRHVFLQHDAGERR